VTRSSEEQVWKRNRAKYAAAYKRVSTVASVCVSRSAGHVLVLPCLALPVLPCVALRFMYCCVKVECPQTNHSINTVNTARLRPNKCR
jgi:hypothetical protein